MTSLDAAKPKAERAAKELEAVGWIPKGSSREASAMITPYVLTKGAEEVIGKCASLASRGTKPQNWRRYLSAVLKSLPDAAPSQSGEDELEQAENAQNPADVAKEEDEGLTDWVNVIVRFAEVMPGFYDYDEDVPAQKRKALEDPYLRSQYGRLLEDYVENDFISLYAESRKLGKTVHGLCDERGLHYRAMLVFIGKSNLDQLSEEARRIYTEGAKRHGEASR